MNNIEAIVQVASATGAALTMEALGVSAGDISWRKARAVYGKRFTDAVKAGRIKPSHVDDGPNGTHHYRVADILQLELADRVRAELQIRNNL